MALTLSFQVSAACAGGNHFGVRTTIMQTAQRIDVPLTRQDFKAPTADEYAEYVRVLMNIFAQQMPSATTAQMKTAVEAKLLDLTVIG